MKLEHLWITASRELDLRAELAAHLNDTQLTKAKAHHAATATTLQWAHLDSISALNHEVTEEEGQKCQAFMGKFSATLQACPSEDHWALMYPLQLLAGGVSLAPLLGMPAAAQLQAVTDTGSIPAPPHLKHVMGTPAPQPGGKHWPHSSDQGMLDLGQEEEEAPDDMPEEPPTKSRSRWLKPSKRPIERPSSKDSEVVRAAQPDLLQGPQGHLETRGVI